MNTPELVRYHKKDQWVVALVQHGTKWTHCIWIDGGPLRVRRVPNRERRYMAAYEYVVSKSLEHLASYAERMGASKQAEAMLKQAIEGV